MVIHTNVGYLLSRIHICKVLDVCEFIIIQQLY